MRLVDPRLTTHADASSVSLVRKPAGERGEERLMLLPLARDAWRLCDREAPAGDAASLLAYIEHTDGVYDVVWLHGRAGRARFESLEAALATAATLLTELTPPARRRPRAIPHLAPRRG